MTIKINKQNSSGLKSVVEKMSGVDLNLCYQCKKCTSGCPVARLIHSPPSEIVRRLQLGAGDELLDSDIVWLCLSCETCYTRCPMQINMAAVIDSLRALVLEKGTARPKGNMPLFNREFLATVKSYGRAYDLGMIAAYKLKSGNLKQDMDKFPTMLKKGKIAILPPSSAGKQRVKQIFNESPDERTVK